MPWLQTGIVIGIIAGYTSVILVMLLGQSRVFFSMSRDGLLPHVFSDVHPQVADAVALQHDLHGVRLAVLRLPADLAARPHDQHRDAAGVRDRVRRRDGDAEAPIPTAPRPYRTPLVPLVPILGILVCLAMMASLDVDTWYRLVIWLAIGLRSTSVTAAITAI